MRRRGLHGGHAGLMFASQVGRDAEHALDQHELSAMMHFVLLHGCEHVETGAAGEAPPGAWRHGHADELVGQRLDRGGVLLAFLFEQRDDLRLVARLGGFGGPLRLLASKKIEAFHGSALFVENDGFLELPGERDVDQQFPDGSGSLGRAVTIFILRNFFRDDQCVLARTVRARQQDFLVPWPVPGGTIQRAPAKIECPHMEIDKVYEPQRFEPHWAEWWVEHHTYRAEPHPGLTLLLAEDSATECNRVLAHGAHVRAFDHRCAGALAGAMKRTPMRKAHHTLWLPGTDHAGIATQMMVERQLAAEGLTKFDLGRRLSRLASGNGKRKTAGALSSR